MINMLGIRRIDKKVKSIKIEYSMGRDDLRYDVMINRKKLEIRFKQTY